jgi:hypothetical protein
MKSDAHEEGHVLYIQEFLVAIIETIGKCIQWHLSKASFH